MKPSRWISLLAVLALTLACSAETHGEVPVFGESEEGVPVFGDRPVSDIPLFGDPPVSQTPSPQDDASAEEDSTTTKKGGAAKRRGHRKVTRQAKAPGGLAHARLAKALELGNYRAASRVLKEMPDPPADVAQYVRAQLLYEEATRSIESGDPEQGRVYLDESEALHRELVTRGFQSEKSLPDFGALRSGPNVAPTQNKQPATGSSQFELMLWLFCSGALGLGALAFLFGRRKGGSFGPSSYVRVAANGRDMGMAAVPVWVTDVSFTGGTVGRVVLRYTVHSDMDHDCTVILKRKVYDAGGQIIWSGRRTIDIARGSRPLEEPFDVPNGTSAHGLRVEIVRVSDGLAAS